MRNYRKKRQQEEEERKLREKQRLEQLEQEEKEKAEREQAEQAKKIKEQEQAEVKRNAAAARALYEQNLKATTTRTPPAPRKIDIFAEYPSAGAHNTNVATVDSLPSATTTTPTTPSTSTAPVQPQTTTTTAPPNTNLDFAKSMFTQTRQTNAPALVPAFEQRQQGGKSRSMIYRRAPPTANPSAPTDNNNNAQATGGVRKFGAAGDKCKTCGKTVYTTERLGIDGAVFHRSCFKCSVCKNTMKLGNYASLDGVYYCKPHFKQLFKSKGNYNEGFGKKRLTHEWAERTGANVEGPLG